MDVSFELLSSMSPKINGRKKCRRRGKTVLALKNHFRRSSIYDKSKPTEKNESLILVESSCSDDSSDESSSKDVCVINKTPIIISDTDLDDSHGSVYFEDKNPHKCLTSPEGELNKNSFLSKAKKNEIESWIETVSDETTKYSELSTIYGEEYKAEGTKRAANSTFIDSASKKFDELFKCKTLNQNPKEQIFIADTSLDLEDSFKLDDKKACLNGLYHENSIHTNNMNDSFQKLCIDDSLEAIENQNIHSKSSKKQEFLDASSNSEDSFLNKEVDSKYNVKLKDKATIKKCKNKYSNYANNEHKENAEKIEVDKVDDVRNSHHSNCFGVPENQDISYENEAYLSGNEENHKAKETNSGFNTPINKEVNNTSPSSNSTTSSDDSSNQSFDKNVGSQEQDDSNHSDGEIKSMLDEIYGNSWRQNENSVLPNSERKPRRICKENVRADYPKTDMKPKLSFLYKNPYVATESAKSNNLLQQLQKSRLRAALESPWISKLKSICDPDSSLEESDSQHQQLHPMKLNFDNDESPKSDFNSYRTNVEISSSDSDKENDTDVIIIPKTTGDRNNKKKINNVRNGTKDTIQKKNKAVEKKPAGKLKVEEVGQESYSFLASLSSNVPINKCDMSARIFRNNFKQYKDKLVSKLFSLYNMEVFDNALPSDMEIKWNERLRGTAGRCDCKRITRRTGVVERNAKILLSTKVLDSADRLRDTLIHEMCHAASWIINQVADGHGSFWQSWAHKARKVFPELPPIERCHRYDIKTKYTYRCTGCSYSIGRHTKSLDIERKRCGYCYGKFEILLNKTSKNGEVKSVPATPKNKVTGFALFVKENYASYKTHQLSHAEVMRLLGQKFAELKT